MDNIGAVLKFLRGSRDFTSGDLISKHLSVSRTAVWKYMNQLERYGYGIEKSKGKGYKLVSTPDRLYPWEIQRHLETLFMGKKIVHKEIVDSTNIAAFRLALAGEQEGTCLIAESQTKGKGRLGRKWCSPLERNIYLSVIVRPSVHPSVVYPITFLSSLAVYDTILQVIGQKPVLKWPNDVLMNGRKLCGTLLELSTEADMVRFVVIGIGLNVNMEANDVDEDIQKKVGSLLTETKKVFERAMLCGMLLTNLEKYYILFREKGETEICRIWEERAQIRDKFMEISQMGESYKGFCRGIDRDGSILLDIDGVTKKIIAGDVSF
ncbi:MAG TPA: biotin--[acetyl-CoA-carboxylase] ligase [Syntrophorhabdaceae bacterium]|nr:biotin--[acetyl-CoA-carboxylase] ligase [Syntrophorhabdaceae bacterium]